MKRALTGVPENQVRKQYGPAKRRRMYGGYRKFTGRAGYPMQKRMWSNTQGILIPQRTFVTLKYAQDIQLNVSGGALPATHSFRANSIYDPNFTSIVGDHQPMGHDQYAAFYQKYVVVSSTITATFKGTSNSSLTSDTNQQYTVGVLTTTPNQLVTDRYELLENNRTSFSEVNPQQPFAKVHKEFNAKKFFGLTRILDNEGYGASMSANPPDRNTCLFELFGYNPVESTEPITPLYVNVVIKYNCILRDRVNLGLS